MRVRTLIVLLAFAVPAFAELYSVNVKRVDQDLYKDINTGMLIQTRWCYEYTYGGDAVLKYEPYAYDNKLIFLDSDTSCEVVKVITP